MSNLQFWAVRIGDDYDVLTAKQIEKLGNEVALSVFGPYDWTSDAYERARELIKDHIGMLKINLADMEAQLPSERELQKDDVHFEVDKDNPRQFYK